MRRWFTVLGLLLIGILAVAWLGTLVEDAIRKPPRNLAMAPAPPRIATIDSATLISQVVRSDAVDDRVLGDIEKQGNRANSAAAYFVAARYEYEHKRYDPAVRYMQRSLEFAPDRAELHGWYAMVLLESGNYSEAVAQGQRATQLEPASADAHRMLGLAYYKTGKLPDAIAAWERSLQLAPDENTRQYLDKARREAPVEQNFIETASGHFVLRYEGGKPAEALTHELLRALEQQFDQLSGDLGITPNASITVILYSNQQFYDVTQAPAWAGALNDGNLRIPLGDVSTITPRLEAVLRHELTHSFVHSAIRHCPVWLDEGLAQWKEPKSLDDFGPLKQRLLSPDTAPLHTLEGSFTGLSIDQAQLAYAKSLAAVLYLQSVYGTEGLRRVLTLLAEGQQFETALREVTTKGYAELEQELAAYLSRNTSSRLLPPDDFHITCAHTARQGIPALQSS